MFKRHKADYFFYQLKLKTPASDCGGITFEPRWNKFSIRTGTVINYSTGEEYSWKYIEEGIYSHEFSVILGIFFRKRIAQLGTV